MKRWKINHIVKISLTLVSLIVLIFMFTNENITYSVPYSVTDFAEYLETQTEFPAFLTSTHTGYIKAFELEAYERIFNVDGGSVSLNVRRYSSSDQAYDAYETLKHQSVLKLIFDINGDSYISFKIDDTYYAAWRNDRTVIEVSSKSHSSLKTFKNFIINHLTK